MIGKKHQLEIKYNMKEEKFFKHLEVMSPVTTGEADYENHWSVIKSICDITQPKNILELGFNRGASALMWLNASDARVHSTDYKEEDKVKLSIDEINKHHKGRFEYTCLNHSTFPEVIDDYKDKYDLVFIDGDHTYEAIRRDAYNVIQMNPTYIAFDDCFHVVHGIDSRNVIKEFGLEIVKEYVNHTGQILTKNTSSHQVISTL